METQTRFDLNTAIENWRAELAAQSDLTGDMRRELESHLRDGIADLQRRGLNDEEAFWVARKRVGQPGQLGKEFIKADPTAVWGEKVFWMTLAVLLVWLWNTTSAIVSVFISKAITNLLYYEIPQWSFTNHYWTDFAMETLRVLIRVVPVCWLAYFVAKGRFNADSRWITFFRSRSRLMVLTLGWSLLNFSFVVWSAYAQSQMNSRLRLPVFLVSYNVIYTLSFPIALIALLLWLMPAHLRAKPKAA